MIPPIFTENVDVELQPIQKWTYDAKVASRDLVSADSDGRTGVGANLLLSAWCAKFSASS